MLEIILHCCILKLPTNEELCIKDGVEGIGCYLVLGSITNEVLRVGESDIQRGGLVALVIGNNLNLVIMPHSYAAVGGSKVNSNCQTFNL